MTRHSPDPFAAIADMNALIVMNGLKESANNLCRQLLADEELDPSVARTMCLEILTVTAERVARLEGGRS